MHREEPSVDAGTSSDADVIIWGQQTWFGPGMVLETDRVDGCDIL